jgi:hypothetical protein
MVGAGLSPRRVFSTSLDAAEVDGNMGTNVTSRNYQFFQWTLSEKLSAKLQIQCRPTFLTRAPIERAARRWLRLCDGVG